MPKFPEIFRKLTPAEYNQYPFMLAVKKDSEACFAPIVLRNVRTLVDRAFVTIAGGLSRSPEDPWAKDDHYFCYSEPIIKPSLEADSTYEYWVLRDLENPVDCVYFKYVCGKINSAFDHGKSLIGEEEAEWSADASIHLTKLESLTLEEKGVLQDHPFVQKFLNQAMTFLRFDLSPACDMSILKEILKDLYNACADIQNDHDLTACVPVSCHANYTEDSGEAVDNNVTLAYYYNTILCSEECWEKTFLILDKITDFDFNRSFAYCDIAGRQDHLSDLGDILSQRVNCLFYHKWADLFQWYSNCMQPASFNMHIPYLEMVGEKYTLSSQWGDFLQLCAFDMSNTTDEYSFLIKNTAKNYWIWKSYSGSSCQNSPCPYHADRCLCAEKKQKTVAYDYKTSRWITNKSFCYDSQMSLILTNLFFFYSSKIKYLDQISKSDFNEIAKIKNKAQEDLDFNFSIIARAIRVFCENTLLALYKIGFVPGQQISCTDSSNLSNNRKYTNPTYKPIYFYKGSKAGQDRISSNAIRSKDRNGKDIPAIDEAYDQRKNPDHVLTCRQDIVDLLDKVNPEMHASGNSIKFDEYEDILGKIEKISKETLGLLKKNAEVNFIISLFVVFFLAQEQKND